MVGLSCAALLPAIPAQAAVAPTVTFSGGILTVTGDAARNALAAGSTPGGLITLNGSVVLGGIATIDNVKLVRMNGGGGDDTLKLGETNHPMPKGDLIGGDGNDTLIGGSADDTFDRRCRSRHDHRKRWCGQDSRGRRDRQGRRRPWRRRGGSGRGLRSVHLERRHGNDHLDGGAGLDTLLFNGSVNDDNVDVRQGAPGRTLVRLISPPFDTVDFGGIEQLKVDTGAGSDGVDVENTVGTDLAAVRLILGTSTSTDDDRVTVVAGNSPVGVRIVGSRAAGVTVAGMSVPVLMTAPAELSVAGGPGADVIDASRLAPGTVHQLQLSGTNGPHAVDGHNTLIGSPDADQIFGGAGGDHIEGRGGDDELFGSPGSDQIFGRR